LPINQIQPGASPAPLSQALNLQMVHFPAGGLRGLGGLNFQLTLYIFISYFLYIFFRMGAGGARGTGFVEAAVNSAHWRSTRQLGYLTAWSRINRA